jgi:hypothetical protein
VQLIENGKESVASPNWGSSFESPVIEMAMTSLSTGAILT